MLCARSVAPRGARTIRSSFFAFYRGVVLKTPADLIRQTLPTVLSENTGKLVFGQLVHFFSRGKVLEIFCQFAARSLRACNDSILYLGLFFLFVAHDLRFVECAQLTQALKTLGAAAISSLLS